MRKKIGLKSKALNKKKRSKIKTTRHDLPIFLLGYAGPNRFFLQDKVFMNKNINVGLETVSYKVFRQNASDEG